VDKTDEFLLHSSDKHPRGLVGTVRLVLLELERAPVNDAQASRQLMSVLALCPPTNTPLSLFLVQDGSHVKGLELITQRENLCRIALLLQRSGLVQIEGERFSMHQLLQRAVRREVAGGVDAAVRLIDARVRGKDLQGAGVYREMLPAAYHVLKEVALVEAARSEWCRGVRGRIAELMHWLGGGALEIEIQRAILQEIGKEHNDLRYRASMRLGTALNSQGLNVEALDLFEHALAFMMSVLPANHPDIAAAMINTAACYTALGRHAEALDLQEQALALLRRGLPSDHPGIAAAMNNTAACYTALGRHAEALDLQEKALSLLQRVFPTGHPDTALALLNAADSYTAVGRHAEALDLREQALALRLRVLPADHPDIANSLFNLAVFLTHCPSFWFANEALQILRSRFSASHPRVIHYSMFVAHLTARHGAACTQPLPPPPYLICASAASCVCTVYPRTRSTAGRRWCSDRNRTGEWRCGWWRRALRSGPRWGGAGGSRERSERRTCR
jgi:tetratricopeptide (TPR) repeat protein